MHADGYGGYKKLYGNQIIEAACVAHVRRKFHDVIKLKPSPVAEEALARIGALYDIEDRIRRMPADERRALRQEHARPILGDLKVWIEDTLQTLPQKQKLAEAMRYALARWAALRVKSTTVALRSTTISPSVPCAPSESEEKMALRRLGQGR